MRFSIIPARPLHGSLPTYLSPEGEVPTTPAPLCAPDPVLQLCRGTSVVDIFPLLFPASSIPPSPWTFQHITVTWLPHSECLFCGRVYNTRHITWCSFKPHMNLRCWCPYLTLQKRKLRHRKMKSLAQITQLVGWLDDMMDGWVNGWMEDEQTNKQKEKYLI